MLRLGEGVQWQDGHRGAGDREGRGGLRLRTQLGCGLRVMDAQDLKRGYWTVRVWGGAEV